MATLATAVRDGRQTVAAPGTAVPLLAAPVQARSLCVTAETDNASIVVVGGATVVAALLTRRGTPLAAGESVSFDIIDPSEVFIDALAATEGVTFTYTI